MAELTREQLLELFRDDLFGFAKFYFEDALTDEPPEFHREMYNLLRDEERLIIAAPRGFAKSTICSVIYPCWLAVYGKCDDICIISASESLAIELVRKIRIKLENDEALKFAFGDLKSDKWTENHLILKLADGTLVNIRAKGAGGQIRGFRPKCVILDDIETDDSVESEEQRKKIKNWLFRACLNTLLPGGQFIIVGTVIHQLSVLSDLLNIPNGWTKRCYKAYKDGVESSGYELWPEARNHDWLQQRKREIGSNRFASEFMNDPKSDEAAPIKEEHIRYWTTLPEQMSCVIAVDPAYSQEESADYKVAVVVGIDSEHNRYLIDYVRCHSPTGEYQDSILNMYIRHKNYLTGLGCPSSGGDREFFNSFVKKASDRNLFPPIVELKNTFKTGTGGSVRSKNQRVIASLQGLFEQGKYYIHHTHIEARDELLTIGSSRWDDLVDAMAYAEQIVSPVFFNTMEESVDEVVNMAGAAEGYGIEY